jgi:HPt (histidine-containing phosphotransfer) domain-containing protein
MLAVIGHILAFLIVIYLAMWFSGLLVSFSAFLVTAALSFNFAVLTSRMVQAGWIISRDLANLGFVLFIIIIAIATILRFQEYGAKRTLGKLIAVALLVNFSLVFAGVFIDFSHMLANFFLKNIQEGIGLGGLSSTLIASYNPQTYLKVAGECEKWSEEEKDPATGKVIKEKECLEYISPEKLKIQGTGTIGQGLLKGDFAVIFTWVSGPIFTTILNLIVSFCLLALTAMLLIRYVSLNILLILVPLACLFIILPATKKLWDLWWNNLIRWVLFLPVVSFFYYLAIFLSQKEQGLIAGIASQSKRGMDFSDIPIADSPGQLLRTVIISALLLGGLFVANSFGITGAKAFLGMAQATGKWARGAIGRMGAAAATRPLRGTWAQTQIEKMQKAGLGGNKFVRAISRPLRTMGGALSAVGVEQGAKLAQQAEARLKSRFASDKSLAMALPTLGHEEQVAAVKRLLKNKTMDLVDERVLDLMIGNKDTENVFKRYGAGKEYGDFEKASGRSTAMFTGKDKEGKPITREEAQKQLFRSYTLKDIGGLRKRSVTEDADAAARVKTLIETNPGALSKLIPKFSGNDFDKFTGNLKAALPEEIEIEVSPAEPEEKDKEGKIIKPAKPAKFETRKTKDLDIEDITEKYLKRERPKLHEALSKTLANRAIGIGEYEYPPPAET